MKPKQYGVWWAGLSLISKQIRQLIIYLIFVCGIFSLPPSYKIEMSWQGEEHPEGCFKSCNIMWIFLSKLHFSVYWPPLRTRSGSGPMNSLMTMVMSEIMSRVGTKIQNVRIRIRSFRSKSAMTFETRTPVLTEDGSKEQAFYFWIFYIYINQCSVTT